MTRIWAGALSAAICLMAVVQFRTMQQLNALQEVVSARPSSERAKAASALAGVIGTTVSLTEGHSKGSETASLILVEYADFQCPYCGAFARSTLPLIEEQFVRSGQLRVVYKHLPLERIHKSALTAAEASECAGQQNKFWEMHDQLFRDQAHLDGPSLSSKARALGLDMAAFTVCMGSTADRIRRDLATAQSIGIASTPSFLVARLQPNGEAKVVDSFSGSKPIAEIAATLGKHLKP